MNDRRRKPAHPGDRTLIICPCTEHRAGWVEAAMNKVLKDDASADFAAGYNEFQRGAEFQGESV